MSVAFRRDSDEEHREPSFAIPIPPGPNLVTSRGKAQIDAKVLACARALAAAKSESAINTARRELDYWQTRQVTAQFAPVASDLRVAFGATVHFRLDGKVRNLTIVGVDEADSALDLIGFTAPLARAMMGAEPGDILPFGERDEAIEILSIGQVASQP